MKRNIKGLAVKLTSALFVAAAIMSVVSTDDDELSNIVKKRGVEVIKRPDELATDKVTLDPVIYHAVIEKEKEIGAKYDIVITMQATSPTLKAETIKGG